MLGPNATVFFSNGAIMVVELVAGRVISRYLGMSLYTWTTIIGAVMAGMSLGNYLGGRVADRYRPRRALAVVFLLAAAGCASVLPLNSALGRWLFLQQLASWPLRIFIHISLVFTLPALLLGTINPIVVKLALNLGGGKGRAVGSVFASGVTGSIVGTFLTGFYLVYILGVTQIMVSAASAMALLGILYAVLSIREPESLPEVPSSAAAEPRASFRDLFVPNATVFASNVAFMVLELAASRVIAREFGASLYTWTTLIGVVLAGISLGNYVGGRIADRWASGRLVGGLFLLASMSVLASLPLSRLGSYALTRAVILIGLSWPAQIVFFTVLAFFIPCIFIGCISPVVVKRALDQGLASGRTVGNIYAWGSVGSILGTFATGYFLIAWMGSRPVIATTGLGMAMVAIGYGPWRIPVVVWIGICGGALVRSLTAGPNDPRIVYEDESQYSYIAVVANEANPRLREMALDRLRHSQVNLDHPTALEYEYEWIYEGILDTFFPNRRPLTTMVIGGGGYTFPRYLELVRPGSYIEVSEIDPAVTEAAHAAFGLPRDTSVHIYNMDARNRVTDLIAQKRAGATIPVFDCILGDSINDFTVPYHLTTLEFTRQIAELMTTDGIYMLNLIDMFQSGAFLGAVVNTCRQVFPLTYVFNTGCPAMFRDTFVVVCTKRPLDMSRIAQQIRQRYDYKGDMVDPVALEERIREHGHMLLTDNYAPVENLLAPVARTHVRDIGEMHLDEAKRFLSQGRIEEALASCRKAVEAHPRWPDALRLQAELLARSGDREGALESLRKAIDGSPESRVIQLELGIALIAQGQQEKGLREIRTALDANPASVRALVMNGADAIQAGNYDLAMLLLEIAVARQPDSVLGHYNLGLALAGKERYTEAIGEWERTVALAPDYVDSYHNLALAYLALKDYAAAWKAVEKIRERNQEPDPALLEALRRESGRSEQDRFGIVQ